MLLTSFFSLVNFHHVPNEYSTFLTILYILKSSIGKRTRRVQQKQSKEIKWASTNVIEFKWFSSFLVEWLLARETLSSFEVFIVQFPHSRFPSPNSSSPFQFQFFSSFSKLFNVNFAVGYTIFCSPCFPACIVLHFKLNFYWIVCTRMVETNENKWQNANQFFLHSLRCY